MPSSAWQCLYIAGMASFNNGVQEQTVAGIVSFHSSAQQEPRTVTGPLWDQTNFNLIGRKNLLYIIISMIVYNYICILLK